MSSPQSWQFTTWLDLFDHWQTLAAGLFALLAAIGTIWATRSTASSQIAAAREQADRMVDAAREQASVTAEQTSQTIYLARVRDAGETQAFRALLEAAMARVLAEAAWAKETYPQILAQKSGSSVEALTVRTSPRARSRSCGVLASGRGAL
jgi:hypothetical protein